MTKRNKGIILVILAVLIVCGALGDVRIQNAVRTSESAEASSLALAAKEEAAAASVAASIAASVAASIEEETAIKTITLSAEDQAMLDLLISKLEEGNYPDAARILNQNEEQWKKLLYETMEGGTFLYDGQIMTEELEGHGLVFKRPTTVFFGAFENGRPNGEVLALQEIKLEVPRYDYSLGTWKDGTMDGPGLVGYNYYEGSEGEENKEIIKRGTFTADLMNGDITYVSTNSEGSVTTWQLSAQNGVTAVDDRWKHNESDQVYSLLAEDNSAHAYIIKEEVLADALWKNMISWE